MVREPSQEHTLHLPLTSADAFYNPPNWKNYNPWDSSASEPAQYVTVDTHQFWAFPPLNNLTAPEILDQICTFGKELKVKGSGIPPTLVGEWSLSTGLTANSTSNTEQDQSKRTWFRTLFEAQNAAYAPNGEGQSSIGWYFWAWKTEYDIDAWSYRKGLADGYIPSNISNASTYVFPVEDNGCINANFSYTAPATVTPTTYTSATGTATATFGGGASGTQGASASATKHSSAVVGVAPAGGMGLSVAMCLMSFLSVA
jgi:glucan 1,3-beta-glucosidase